MPLIESFPIYIPFLAAVAIMLLSCELGYQLGVRVRTRHEIEAPASLGSMVTGLLGMMAFVLAFTFSIASGHYDARKTRVLEEANAVGTAYLRADLLEAPYGDAIKSLLREYVDVRLQTVTVDNYMAILERSEQIHGLLWNQVREAAAAQPDTNTQLAVESINNVIDMHSKRAMVALFTRIPASMWMALLAIAIFCMLTMGVQIGFAGKRRLIAVIPMLLAFSVLVTLVIDLDRPQSGFVRVGQQAMIDLQRTMALKE